MGIPIFVLAVQSNAVGIESKLRAQLDAQYGAGGNRLVSVGANGAPLPDAMHLQDRANLTELLADLVNQTVQALNATPTGYIAGIIWFQAEADTISGAPAGRYGERLTDLVNGFRSAVDTLTGDRATGVETANFVISTLSVNPPAAANRANWESIIAAHRAVVDSMAHARLVEPDRVAPGSGVDGSAMFRDDLHDANKFASQLANALIAAAQDTNDRLHGTAGADLLIGGAGDDVFLFKDADERIVDLRREGNDEVSTSMSVSLPISGPALNRLTLTGTDTLYGFGDSQNNVSKGNDLLPGGGNDRLIGEDGTDQLTAGSGADVFVFNDVGVRREQVMAFENDIDRIDLRGNGLRGFSDLVLVAYQD